AGVFTQTLSNQFGCDSTVITTVMLSPENTVNLTATTCDPSQAGVFTQNLSNQFGCDSTVITTIALLPENTVNLSATTCDPSQAGVFTQALGNQFGCDSTVITTVALLPENTVNLSATTCDPSQAGVFTQTLSNQFGCDSTVITTVALLPENTLNLSATTCDPSQAGVFTQTLSNQFGCDSTVITTVALLPENTLNLSATTCDSTAAGTFVQVLQNQFGCDSIVTTTVLYDALLCGPVVSVSATDPGCNQGDNGVFEVAILSGQPPLAYSWAGAGLSGSGQLSNLSSPLRVEQLPAGQYSITITDLNNQTKTVATVTLNPATIPAISLPADTVIVQGHALRIEAVTNVSNWQSLVWTPLPDSACATCLVQEWTPLANTFLSVRVTDFAGCRAEASIRIFVKQVLELYVPNVFSPDEDGVNDIWLLNAGPSVPELQEVLVFDRWGDLHYQWRSALPPNGWPGWDGTARGQKATPGVYVYALKVKMADGEIVVVKGDLTLLK
ncbi:MAG: gliding motility-associated C-terminal domain-containing protein, partial [Saprospiraceae bacterium]|nr:gliding motility-associated C-terminal domain-containing protein [Saprospiraceae bacterium]